MAEKDDEGPLLEEAIRIHGDPQLWAEYRAAISRQRSIPPRPSYIGGSMGAWRQWEETYGPYSSRVGQAVRAAEQALHQAFRRRLRSGEFVASGLRRPVTAQSRPETIAAALWDMLDLDVDHNRARSRDLVYEGVRVRLAADCPAEGTAEPAALERPPALTHEAAGAIEVWAPGRPSIMDRIRAEWRQRNAAGRLSDNRAANARDLHRWAVDQGIDQAKIPHWKSIERRIRDQYKQAGLDKQTG